MRATQQRKIWTVVRHSIRTQLVLWNIAALALLFCALGVVIRYAVVSTLMTSIDQDLDLRTRAMSSDSGVPPPGESFNPWLRMLQPSDWQGTLMPPPPPFPSLLNRSSKIGGDFANLHPRRFDLTGKSLEAGEHHVFWDIDQFDLAKSGRTVYANIRIDDQPIRLISRPFPLIGTPQGVIQAIYPLEGINRAVHALNRVLLWLIPVALICAALAGMLLTGRVLGRIRRMTQAAGRIGAQNTSDRIPVTGEDEFAELAETFNELLGRLEAVIDQQRRFTADASHELKTPLTIIKGNTGIALEGLPDEHAYQEILQEIDQATDSMSGLVRDLLLLARSDADRLEVSSEDLDLRAILEKSRILLPRKGIAPITFHFEQGLPRLRGSEDKLVRLFANLLMNAARHTPTYGRITVIAYLEEQSLVTEITDTGIGIAPEHLTHLGERFYRVDKSRSRTDGGIGLGLSICQSILKAHDGALTIESCVGVGTTVRVSLPATVPLLMSA